MSLNKKNGNFKEKPLLLFSPLDWGLGHTTRSIPLIRELFQQGCDVLIACNSIQKKVLQAEFPALTFLDLEGYGLIYGPNGLTTKIKIVLQLRKILTRIKFEKEWLTNIIGDKGIDGVISDNRYGLYHPGIPSVLVTHQLKVKSGTGKLADRLIQKILYRFINNFTCCWVPDFKDNQGIAGELSHPVHLPDVPVHYLGGISRLKKCVKPLDGSTPMYDMLIILSGPEPQRTILENIMFKQLKDIQKNIVLIRGLPGQEEEHKQLRSVEIFNHVPAEKLNELVCRSRLIICRSGYTTVMDMLKLQKKMVVIPTPGQSEQQYLARDLSSKKLAVTIAQNKFSFEKAELLSSKFDFKFIEDDMDQFKKVITEFVTPIKLKKQQASFIS